MITRTLFTIALGILSAGCITFEQQTLTYQRRVAEDRLLIYNVYTGIYGDSEGSEEAVPAELSQREQQELTAAVRGRQAYFFDNWIQAIDLDELEAQLRAGPDPDLSPSKRRADDAEREAWAALVKNMSISNGPFFQDEAGRLCAVQRITISNLSETLRLLNVALTEYASAQSADDPAWLHALGTREWLTFDGNRFTFRYPSDEGDAGDRVRTRVVGSIDAPRVTLTGRVRDRYRPNALEFVGSRFGIQSPFDPREDADRFFASAGPHR
jgi:hypothetical protein